MFKSYSIAVVLCAVLTMVLTFAVLKEAVLADSVECLAAETAKTNVQADANGFFDDDRVYLVFASTGNQPSNNVVITMYEVSNINDNDPAAATPSSYNLFWNSASSLFYVINGHREINVSGQLDTVSQPGEYDCDVKVTNEGSLDFERADMANTTVTEF